VNIPSGVHQKKARINIQISTDIKERLIQATVNLFDPKIADNRRFAIFLTHVKSVTCAENKFTLSSRHPPGTVKWIFSRLRGRPLTESAKRE
jgi:hypothetical protein